MPVAKVQFEVTKPTLWEGRYARVPGDETVFHLVLHGGRRWPVIYWTTDEGTATCAAIKCDAAEFLADAVYAAKRSMGGAAGGSFAINEFGQVIVPSSRGDGTRMLAGQLNGKLLFKNPFDPDSPIDLSNTEGLQPGDPWKLPYVGMPHRLSGRRKVYFWQQNGDEGFKIEPERQDAQLITNLLQFRGGACRFLVNPAGVVLTKREDHDRDGSWEPFFIGRINIRNWFTKGTV